MVFLHRNRTGTMRFRTDDLRGLGLSTVGGFEALKVIIKIKFDDYQIEVPVFAKSIIDNNLKNQHVFTVFVLMWFVFYHCFSAFLTVFHPSFVIFLPLLFYC